MEATMANAAPEVSERASAEMVFRNGKRFSGGGEPIRARGRECEKARVLVSGNELRDASNEPQGSTFPIRSGWMMRRRGGKEEGARRSGEGGGL